MSNTDIHEEAQAAPLACLLTGDELKERGDAIQPLMASHLQMQELEDGYAFQFPGEPEWIQRVLTFVTEERQCCPFFTFELQFEPNLGRSGYACGEAPRSRLC